MNIIDILNDESLKSINKRKCVIDVINDGNVSIKEIKEFFLELDDKKKAIVFEAIEEVTRNKTSFIDLDCLEFCQDYIVSKSNNLKREASRIIGNLATRFPNNLDYAINLLLKNTKDDGTVIRWGSAYALAKIVALKEYASTELYDMLTAVYDWEENSGIKNQYLKGLKKAEKIRN